MPKFLSPFSSLLVITTLAASIARADCPKAPPTQPVDPLSDRPYAIDLDRPCKDVGEDIVQPSPPPIRKVAFGGMGSGAALLGLGGVFWLGGALSNDPGTRRAVFTTAAVVGIAGAALFIAGTTVLVISGGVSPPVGKGPPSEELLLRGTF